jgi:putative DNA primase/helicase
MTPDTMVKFLTTKPDAHGEFNSPLDGALFLAALGIPQTPLRAKTKIALLPSWQQNASTDPEQIKKWAHDYPDCNFGSVALPGGIFVFEADSPKVRERFKAQGGDFTSSLITESSPGKGHRYYRQVPGVENIAQSDTLYRDFSLRVTNMYCVSPGSVHPATGRQYRLLASGAPAAPSEQEIAFWTSEKKAPTKPKAPEEGTPILQGARNATLTSIAGGLRQKGLNRDELEAVLLRMNEERCQPPLDDNEVKAIAASVARYAVVDTTVLHNGIPVGAQKTIVEQEIETPDVPYRLIGAERDLVNPESDVVLVFPTEAESELASRLGLNAVAVINGGDGLPFHASMTMLKTKYNHFAIFGSTEASASLHQAINPGSILVDYPPDESKPIPKDRKTHPKFQSLVEALAAMGDDLLGELSLQDYLNRIVSMDAVRAATVLRGAAEKNALVKDALERGLAQLGAHEPRIVYSTVMENLRRLQFLDTSYPKPLTSKSLCGLLGEFVEIAYPTTVACREMILYGMLPLIGVLLGNRYYGAFGSGKHFPSIFSLIIARTSDGKGQATDHCEQAVKLIDSGWASQFLHTSVASGEGLVRMLAGTGMKLPDAQSARVAISSSEMSVIFNAQNREGSILSGHLRSAYDGKRVENYRSERKKSIAAEDYILGFLGSITPRELQQVMPKVDWTNGTANRFLWCFGRADKKLSRSKAPDFTAWAAKTETLIDMNVKQKAFTPLEYSKAGQECWDDWYRSLPEPDDTILSDSQARVHANCLRVANLYAQLDERRLDGWQVALEPCHIEAAIEIVDRSRQSVEWYLTEQLNAGRGQTQYGEILKLKAAMAAKARETGMAEVTGEEVYKLFSHRKPEERDGLCIRAGFKMGTRRPSSGGKPAVIWKADL